VGLGEWHRGNNGPWRRCLGHHPPQLEGVLLRQPEQRPEVPHQRHLPRSEAVQLQSKIHDAEPSPRQNGLVQNVPLITESVT
jgi:hypothetical protein